MKFLNRSKAGFTLVELMIVIAILGLLAAIAIPQFMSNKEEGKAAATVSSLAILRTAIDSYWSQHDTFPGQKNAAEFADQLLKNTNKAGKVGTGTGYGYGPYIRNNALPVSQFTNTATVKVVSAMPNKPTGSEAWIYCNTTGEIRCNTVGTTLDGVSYFSL